MGNTSELESAFEELLISVSEMVGMKSINPKLHKLQTHVFLTHTHLENSLDYRIFIDIFLKNNDVSEENMYKLSQATKPLFQYIPFSRKIQIVENFGDTPKSLVKHLTNVNKLRNDFAHPRGGNLEKQYLTESNSDANRAEVYAKLNNALLIMKKYLDDTHKLFEERKKQKDDDIPF